MQGSAHDLLVDVEHDVGHALELLPAGELGLRYRMEVRPVPVQQVREVLLASHAVECQEPAGVLHPHVALGPEVAWYPQQVGEVAVVPQVERLQVLRGAGHLDHEEKLLLCHRYAPAWGEDILAFISSMLYLREVFGRNESGFRR